MKTYTPQGKTLYPFLPEAMAFWGIGYRVFSLENGSEGEKDKKGLKRHPMFFQGQGGLSFGIRRELFF